MYNTEESPAPVCSASTAWIRSQCPGVPLLVLEFWTKARHTVDLVTRLDEVNGDNGFIELKVRMTPRKKSLRLSRGWEPTILKIGFPVMGF